MRSGPRHARVEIQYEEVAKDAVNAEVKTWKKLHDVWMEILYVKGEERFKSQAISGRQVVTFHGPLLPGVSQRNRVIYEDEPYDIFDYSIIGRREGMQLICLLIDGNEHEI